MPAWPGTVPHRPLRASWAPGEPEGMRQEREVEDGPPLARRRKLAEWTRAQPVIRMTPAEFGAFRTFHRVDLNMGAQQFDMPVWVRQASAYETRTCQLSGWSAAPAGPADTYVTLQLLIRDL